MMQNKKSSKGITLISMILAVIVLMIIMGTISYSSRNSFQTRSLQNLYTDIDGINDAVSVYYMKNKLLPIYTSYYDYNGNPQEYGYIVLPNTYNSANNTYFFNFKEDGRDADTAEKNIYFGIIDIDKIKSTNLNEKNNLPKGIGSGEFFKPKTGSEPSDLDNLKQSIKDGIFVMNMSTHRVYYTKGILSDGKKYFARNVYTKGASYFAENGVIDVPSFYTTNDGQSLDETILSQGDYEVPADAIRVKYFANGGAGAPPETIITQDMITSSPYLSSYISTTEPSRTGMNFLGWAFTTGNSSSSVKYAITQVPSHGSYYSIVRTNGEDIRLPNATYAPGSTINLYAVWEVRNDILLCYYPDDTGGIKPTISPYKVSRTSNIPDGVINYLCVDIESSGYKLTWNWDYTKSDVKEALYEGTRTIDITDESGYITTEPGTIKLKGSFTNLKVSVEKLGSTESEFNFEINEKDVLNIYNTELSQKRRDKVGSRLGTEWLVGKNRAFTIPENVLSYKNMGIKDPQGSSGTTYYADELDTDADYFLKKMVVVESVSNISSILHDYQNNSYAVGKVAQLPDDNKNYSMYPYFASRNYRLSSSSPDHTKYYYHDNLQEAYDDSVEKAEEEYDKITVLNTVKYSKVQADYIYENRFDPACESVVNFDKNGALMFDCSSYYLNRKKAIIIGYSGINTDITMVANSGGGLRFEYEDNTDASLRIKGASSLTIDDGCTIVSNTKYHLIYMDGSSKLAILKARIENSNTTDDTRAMISTYSNNTTACIGCEDEDGLSDYDSSKDSDITLKNPNGYVLDFDRGNFYWNYGILFTKKPEYKAGYTPNTESYITTSGINREACIYKSGSDYKVQLKTRLWEFNDTDSGNARTYYSNSLYNAHDMYNIKNNTLTTKTLKFTKNSMVISDDYATITKDVILDYNTDSSNYIYSTNGYLIFNHSSTIKNCYMTLITNTATNGIVVGNSSNIVSLDLTNSNIYFSNSSNYRYCVYNNYGTFTLLSDAIISGKNGLYNGSGRTATINGLISNSNTGCTNAGTLEVNGTISSTGSSYPALDNTGTANVYFGAMLTSSSTRTMTNSGTANISSAYVGNTYSSSSGYAISNTGTLNLTGSTVDSKYGGITNSNVVSAKSSTIKSSNNTTLSNSGTVTINACSVNAGTASKTVIANTGSIEVNNGTNLKGSVSINSSGYLFFPQGSAVYLNGSVTVNGNGDFTMGDSAGTPSASNPKVSGRVTVNSSGWFYYYDGYVGSLSIRGSYNPEFSMNGLSIPYHGGYYYDYVYSGSAHYIQLRKYDEDGTWSYWQGGVHYNPDGTTPYVDPNAEGEDGGSSGGNFDEFGNENL